MVSVSLSGSSLTVDAVAGGTATVTVTATDPDGLTATQSANITVAAGNQAPEAVGTIPAQTMEVGQTATVDVSSFFSDPDSDDLTYTAESSDADVVGVSIEGSSLRVTAVAVGTETVTVTAADPDGLTAMQSAEVTVAARSGFGDDFDSDASLDDWELYSASAEVVDGVLHLTGTDSELIGTADHVLETPVTEWALGTRMARNTADEPALVYWVTGHDRFPVFRLVILDFDDGDNYWLAMYDGQREGYVSVSEFAGNSDAIAEPGEFMDISFSHQNGEFALVVGDTELFRVATSGSIGGVQVSDFVDRVEEVWLGTGSNGDKALFDWVDLSGFEIGGRMADGPGAPGIGSLRRVKDVNRVRLDIPTPNLTLKTDR